MTDSLRTAFTQHGDSLDELSRETPVLVVFLRHAGCPFCRETLAALKRSRQAIEEAGVRIVLVHMASDAEAANLFQKYGLEDAPRISDPERRLYDAFELKRGKLHQVMGPAVWWKGFKTTILKGHLPGVPRGDVMQLPGTFLLHNGEIVNAHRPTNSAERPDFVEFVKRDEG